MQFLLSLIFAVSATPLLAVSENLVDSEGWHVPQDFPQILIALFSGTRKSLWIAGATNFELTYGFALALATGFMLYRRFKNSELRLVALERAWSQARLEALRAQLSPHTLFNLLHTIRGHIAWDPAAAQSMIVQLGDLLRGLLAAGEREFSTLAEELQFARTYLELQQKRFAERVKLSLPEAQTLPSAWVPSLILQPLVENAIVHGLAGHEGEVSIQMEVAIDGDTLALRLMNSVAAGRISDRHGGIGLRNIRERLAVHFGDRFEFNARLDQPQRWRAEMRFPLLPVESAGRSAA
jgi:sensor histidine kinase YesM